MTSTATAAEPGVGGTETHAPADFRDVRLLPFHFSGDAKEYFRIWIVNVLLTVVTIGIYSAWAKVRTKRYFHGNTTLDGHAFDYHATGKQILKGRLVVFAIFVVYGLVTNIFPLIAPLFAILFMAFAPWMIRASLRFNARYTSWRNVRLDFTGTTLGAFKAYVLWPLAGSLTLGLLMPHATRAMWRYTVDNHRYGNAPMHLADMPLKPLYKGLLGSGAALVGAAVVAVFIVMALATSNHINTVVGQVVSAVFVIGVFALFLFAVGIYQGIATKTALAHLTFDDRHALGAEFSGVRLSGILATNYALTAVTLGLARPWCAVRVSRYVLGNLVLAAQGDLSEYVDSGAEGRSAVGEEFAAFEGMDFGIA